MRQFRDGYTLVELLLVLALVVILSAAIIPSVDGMYESYRLTGGADEARGAWAAARSHAMDEGVPYECSVVLNKGNYRVARYGGDQAGISSASTTPSTPSDSDSQPFVLEGALPKGLRFVSVDSIQTGSSSQDDDTVIAPGSVDSNGWSHVLTFNPDGTARQDAAIAVQARWGTPLVLKLRSLTGIVTVRQFQASEGHP